MTAIDALTWAGNPSWPTAPGEVDGTGSSFLVLAAGHDEAVGAVANGWVEAAEPIAPTRLVVIDSMSEAADRETVGQALAAARTGVRIMIVGGQYDVMTLIATARAAGAINQELSVFATHTRDLPLYCAHCRDTYRVAGAPGAVVDCPGCARPLEIHPHHSAVLGSYLASASDARDF